MLGALKHNLRSAALVSGALALAACGAPTKSASDVASLFEGSATSLQDKETDLCNNLAGRTTPPTTQGMTIDLGGCQQAGLGALNYSQVKSFYFMGLDDQATPTATAQSTATSTDGSPNGIIHKGVRAQLWLNKSLLGLASALSAKLQQKSSGDDTGIFSLPDSAPGQGISNLITPTLTITQQPTFDLQNMAFSMKLNITTTGIVIINNDISIDGQLIGNNIAVTVRADQDQPLSKSLINNFQAVLLIIPHADDLYMDLFVDVNVNSIGFDSLVKDDLDKFLSTGLKSMVDSVMTLSGS